MAFIQITRFAVADTARAERAMHDHAAHVRATEPDAIWNGYRSLGDATRFIALLRADSLETAQHLRDSDGGKAFHAALVELATDDIEMESFELVTSSDLSRRHRAPKSRAGSRRRPR